MGRMNRPLRISADPVIASPENPSLTPPAQIENYSRILRESRHRAGEQRPATRFVTSAGRGLYRISLEPPISIICGPRGPLPPGGSNTRRVPGEKQKPARVMRPKRAFLLNPGSVLLSHRLAATVASASEGLTAVFGMGTGGAPPVWPPGRWRAAAGPPPEKSNLGVSRPGLSGARQVKPHGRLGRVSYTRYRASTSRL